MRTPPPPPPQGSRERAALLVAALAVVAAAWNAAPEPGARADETTGTWTGAVETRGNYYWERSTRVLAPTLHAELAAPNGLRLSADYLVDAITSASVAAGVNADIRFTEIRHDVGLGAAYEHRVGEDAYLLTSVRARWSEEPDYSARSVGLSSQLSLNERTTLLSLSASWAFDDVRMRVMGGPRMGIYDVDDQAGIKQTNPWDIDFHVLTLTAGWSQVLSPRTVMEVGYDLGYLDGYQHNVYRQVAVAGTPRPENHPRLRWRHALYGRFAYYLAETRSSLQLLLRGYADSWDILAITPEVRVYQELGRLAQLRLRWRHYNQTAAFFYREPIDYVVSDVWVTADPKMSRFHSNLLGVQLLLSLDFLTGSALDFARGGAIDFGFDYLWNTNRFGNGVIAQVGLRLPF
jgi:hypothetical protein